MVGVQGMEDMAGTGAVYGVQKIGIKRRTGTTVPYTARNGIVVHGGPHGD